MGPRQEAWFYRKLRESTARWKLIGQQIVVNPVNASFLQGYKNPMVYDGWDGYAANRKRTYNALTNVSNAIFLSGDLHANWVSDLAWQDGTYDPRTGNGSLAVEFAGSAVSSYSSIGQNISLATGNAASKLLTGTPSNQGFMWQEFYYRGYYELEIDYDAVTARYFGIPNIQAQHGVEISLANFTVKNGENKLDRSSGSLASGFVESGSMPLGKTIGTNMSVDTKTGEWSVYHW